MTQAEHTKEPWLYSDIFDSDGGGIVAGDNGIIVGGSIKPNPQRVVDLQRAVVCVNACTGLNPEAIQGAIAALEGIAKGKVSFRGDVEQSTTMFLYIAKLQNIALAALATVKVTTKGGADG